jgi:F0F1-type ATP synthase delta subunit
MEEKHVYGKHTNDVPGLNTLKTLEKRKNYLLKKVKEKIDKESYFLYITEELKALEKTMNFIKWIQNNSSNDLINEIIEQYKKENHNQKDDEEIEINEEKDMEVCYSFIEKFNKKRKF